MKAPVKRTRATPEYIDRLAALYAQNLTYNEIAAVVGSTRNAVAALMIRYRERFPLRGTTRRHVGQDRRAEAARLLADGATRAEVAAHLKVSRKSIALWIKADPILFKAPTAAPAVAAAQPSVAAVGPATKERKPSTRKPAATPEPQAPSNEAPETSTEHAADDEAPGGAIADDRPVGAAAFLPLPGTTPVALMDAKGTGCRWPVHIDGRDPLRSATTFVCDQPRTGGKLSYCCAHLAMHGGRGSAAERSAHRSLISGHAA